MVKTYNWVFSKMAIITQALLFYHDSDDGFFLF